MHRLTEVVGVPVLLICFSSRFGQGLYQPPSHIIPDTVYKATNFDDRDTRTLGIDLAARGLLAAQHLLKGTKAIRSYSDRWRKYEKPGDLQTAIKDYYSVKPAESVFMNLRLSTRHQVGKILSGTVGDRWVVLRMDGDKYSKGRPVLEIIDTVPKPGPGTDKIVYVPNVRH